MKIEAFINGIPIEEIPEEEREELIKKMLIKAAASIGLTYNGKVITDCKNTQIHKME
ncbi:MAG: hypothetical protein AB9856_20695 [Cellulosilyticaceae bacterium]